MVFTIIAVTNISKIQSESNSQLLITVYPVVICCDQYFKDTIWKQFTTCYNIHLYMYRLWPIFQRYNLKAIHNMYTLLSSNIMLWPIFQRYNLKAIHNPGARGGEPARAVTNISKIQSESNSQRIKWNTFSWFAVTNISKIQSESNSQLAVLWPYALFGCDQYFKDTIWKQFTTFLWSIIFLVQLWPIFQRYNLKAIHNQDYLKSKVY